jgi:hypothetical protein
MTGFQALPAHAQRERAALERMGCHDWPALAQLQDQELAQLASAGGASLATLVRLRGQARLVVELDLHPGQAALLLHAGVPDRRSLASADPQQLYEVICHSAGNSWMFENRMPHVLAGDYTPLSSVNIFVKDLGIVLDQARALTFPLPLASAAVFDLGVYLTVVGATLLTISVLGSASRETHTPSIAGSTP